MAQSAFEQPPGAARAARAARAHGVDGKAGGVDGKAGAVRWHVYPELAAAGLWTTPSDLARFAIEVQRARRGEQGRALSPQAAQAMTTPVGVGTFALGFQLQDRGSEEQGPAWYFGHSGGNWGFACNLVAHLERGYGYAAMINGGRWDAIREIQQRLAEIYGWQGDFSRPPRNWPEDD
jgi:CubicO group peptidase (beta-lactamase class C family)